MYLQYGNIVLRVIDLIRFERETVWTEDGTDLESVMVTLGVTATYVPGGRPALVSVDSIALPTRQGLIGTDPTRNLLRANLRGFPPTYLKHDLDTGYETDTFAPLPVDPATQSFSGPETDAELRTQLWLPRQKLILWAYTRQDPGDPIRWLESPRPGYSVDLGTGPKPIKVDIVSVQGEPHAVAVYFEIQTEISPCPSGADKLILSHRWEMSHRHDENRYLTRVIDGRIRFNNSVVQDQAILPDAIRNQMIHPIPLGYYRTVPVITQSSDGLTIRYVVMDTDPTIIFDPGSSDASHMEIEEKTVTSVDWKI